MSNKSKSNVPQPRLCHLRQWPDFSGYGFNLHWEKQKRGQFIGKVDDNSPADSAGLKEHDRIIEVNYSPIENDNHKEVVSKIKNGLTRNGTTYPNEVVLLVVDPITDQYYKKNSITITSADPNVQNLETKLRNNNRNGDDLGELSNDNSDKIYSKVIRASTSNSKPDSPPQKGASNGGATANPINNSYSRSTSEHSDDDDSDDQEEMSTTKRSNEMSRYQASPPPYQTNPPSEHPMKNNNEVKTNSLPKPSPEDSLAKRTNNIPVQPVSNDTRPIDPMVYGLSAAEYRERLKSQQVQKRDKQQNKTMSMKDKYDLVNGL